MEQKVWASLLILLKILFCNILRVGVGSSGGYWGMFLPSFTGFCEERVSLNLPVSCLAPGSLFPLESGGDSTQEELGIAPQSLPLSFFCRSQKTREMTCFCLLLQYAVGFRGVRPHVAICSYLVLPVMGGEGNKSVYSGRISIRKFTIAIYQSHVLHYQASSVHIIKYFKLFKYFKWIKIQIILHFDFHELTGVSLSCWTLEGNLQR